jgi:hypothetical protein
MKNNQEYEVEIEFNGHKLYDNSFYVTKTSKTFEINLYKSNDRIGENWDTFSKINRFCDLSKLVKMSLKSSDNEVNNEDISGKFANVNINDNLLNIADITEDSIKNNSFEGYKISKFTMIFDI